MSHVQAGQLQAFLDDELPLDERVTVERHVRGCAACRAEVAELEAAAALFSDAARDLGRLERPSVPARPATSRAVRGWGAQARRSLPRAAVLVLGFAAAASATLPGSPAREWLEGLLRREPAEEASAVAAAPAPPVEEAAPEAGVSVAPLNGGVRVVLRDASPELVVRARLTNGARAGVYATGDAAAARFRSSPGRLEVSGAGAGELRVELPRDATDATVVVNGREYLRKEGDQLRLALPSESQVAPEVSFQVRR